MAKISKKKTDERIGRLYHARCSGITINIMDITKIHKVTEQAIAADPSITDADPSITDADLGDKIAAYVETIRKN